MSKKSQIRVRESDLDLLRKSVKNYNAKRKRLQDRLAEEGRRYEIAMLPPKASVKAIRKAMESKTDIYSRLDFNREIERMRNFVKTGVGYTIDKNTRRSLESVSAKFNAKVDRLLVKAKTQGERAALPEKISVEDLIKNAPNKEALKEDISDFRGFLKRGAEALVELPDTKHNIKITKWQNDLMDREIEKINAVREREKKIWQETEVRSRGKDVGYTQGEIRMNQGDHEFYPITKYSWSSTHGDLRERLRLILRERKDGYWDARTELARLNYISAIERYAGGSPIARELIKRVSALPLEEFKRTMLGVDDLFTPASALEYHQEALEPELEKLWNEWGFDDGMYEWYDSYINRKVSKI